MYTKFVIVTDDDINARDWNDVIWAITTRMDPKRDTVMIDNTPIDYLDFASPISGLGSKMGLDATHKWPVETNREGGRVIGQDAAVKQRVAELCSQLGVDRTAERQGRAEWGRTSTSRVRRGKNN